MTARRSLTVLPGQLTLNAPIAVGRIRQRDVPHLITMGCLSRLTRFFLLHVTPSVTQLPVRQVDVPGEAGQADMRLVLEHLGVEREGLLNAQRPRAFFAM
ncbi:hypothetical protein QR90_04870 [Deinococcus radiopugnans]|uniref:Uncharacterized protein n=1 Tax=Deinococcus radiopugnans TaxID=57497 RepID=A0A0A7KEN6_9DEIO|nr:hypothetical protein QR90_04840 [Deinococcus radiopugnans]AIZ44565.1 hypothetical protein QR90_04870 [Deinococcus radiopugnans]